MTDEKKMSGYVYLVGAGPGDPGLITKKAMDCLKTCDVVIYDSLSNDSLLEYVKPECKRIYVGKRAGAHSMKQEEINSLIVRYGEAGKAVVRLKGGDPFVFGRGGEEALALKGAGIPFRTIPGVTSAVAALEAAGIPVTHRGMSRSFHVMTGHTMEGSALPEDFSSFARLSGTLVFLMGLRNLPLIVRGLLENGKPGETPAAVIQNGTMPDQRVVRGTLETIEEQVKIGEIGSPAVIAVGPAAALELLSEKERPLEGKRFGITGTSHFRGKLSEVLTPLGALPETLCSMELVSHGKSEGVREIWDDLDAYSWLVFTSANGVRLFFEEMMGAGKDVRSLYGCKLAAVGDGTAGELKRFGLLADYIPERYCTESLARGLAERLTKEDRVLIPRSAKGARILPQVLGEAGIPFLDLALYDVEGEKMDGRKLAEKISGMDCLIFGSASGVDGVFQSLEKDEIGKLSVPVACIGAFTAKRLEKYGIKAAAVAEKYDVSGLAGGILEYFTQD